MANEAVLKLLADANGALGRIAIERASKTPWKAGGYTADEQTISEALIQAAGAIKAASKPENPELRNDDWY